MKRFITKRHKKAQKGTKRHKKAQKGTKRHKHIYKGGVKSNYDDYDYLEGTYKRLMEQSRHLAAVIEGIRDTHHTYGDFKKQHLYLYGYDYFVGANKLIPIKNEVVGFNGIENVRVGAENPKISPRNMPTYYYMSELVYRNNIITIPYWGHNPVSLGFNKAGIRGYVREEDIITDPPVRTNPPIKRLRDRFSNVGVPPIGNPKAWKENNYYAYFKSSKPPSYDTSVSDKYIDKFLYFPRQNYKMIIIKPTRESNVYDTEIGKIELNDPGNDEDWFDKEVVVVFDEFFIPPPLGTIDEPEYNTSGVGEEMMRQND